MRADMLRKWSGERVTELGRLSGRNILNLKSCRKFITWTTTTTTLATLIALDLISTNLVVLADDQHASMFDDQLVGPLDRAPLRANSPPAEVVNSLVGVPMGATNHQRAMNSKLHIIRLFAPEAVQNATQNVTLDCMFKFDPKLDQRLTIKWYFNDELEPIYQWIPELNKRVYSDRYEHLIDKSYQITDDVDWMLQAYKKLSHAGTPSGEPVDLPAEETAVVTGSEDDRRKLLANRLNRLAKLGGEHSRALLTTLRSALAMDSERASKFRALRLIKPPLELAGRFTCSVSSLDGDDLASTRLLIYEPPKSFNFNVTRTPAGHLYNLTCAAGPTFPRPSLALVRYRQATGSGDLRAAGPSSSGAQLRPELVGGVQTQLKVSASRTARRVDSSAPVDLDLDLASTSSNQIGASPEKSINLDMDQEDQEFPERLPVQRQLISPFEISAWALVDESSLSSSAVTQFECVLTLDGTNYEQRQSLALQKGWHVNSQALMARSTLVGLMSVLASLLCLIVALVSALLVFKLMRRHANKTQRVHQTVEPKSARGQTNRSCADLESASSSSSSSPVASTLTSSAVADERQPQPRTSQSVRDNTNTNTTRQQVHYSSFGHQQQQQSQNVYQSDGIYRVPSDAGGGGPHYAAVKVGTRFAPRPRQIAPGNDSQAWTSSAYGNHLQQQQQNRGQLSGILRASGSNREQVARATPATISVNGKQLYC